MTVSVCLCTYNGERFLPELLKSLLSQTQLPDELLIGDDLSSDGTRDMLESFASEATFPVQIVLSKERMGPGRNLERLMQLSQGDVILPCDQDDIWHRSKIAAYASRLQAPGCLAAIADSALIDADGARLPGSLFERIHFDQLDRERLAQPSGTALVNVAARNCVASHALGLHRNALRLVLPFGSPWQADWWMALVLAATTGIRVLDGPLVYYRLHDANTIGLPDKIPMRQRVDSSRVTRFEKRAEMLERVLERLALLQVDIDDESRSLLTEPIAHLKRRADLADPRRARLVPVVLELRRGGYQRFSNGWRSAIVDLARPTQPAPSNRRRRPG